MQSRDSEAKAPEAKPTVDPPKAKSVEDRVAALEVFMAHVAHITGVPPAPSATEET